VAHLPSGLKLAVATALYIAAAAASFIDPWLGVVLCLAIFAGSAWCDPDFSLFLLILTTPFERLFQMDEFVTVYLLGAQVLIQIAAAVYYRRPDLAEFFRLEYWHSILRTRAWPIFAIYVLLAAIYANPNVDFDFRLKTVAFGIPVLCLIALYDGRMNERTCRAVVLGVIASAVLQIIWDVAFLGGLDFLVRERWWRPVGEWRSDVSFSLGAAFDERLRGLTFNSNHLAEFLLAAICFIYTSEIIKAGKYRWAKLFLICFLYCGVALTVSKAAMAASAVVLLTATAVLAASKRWRQSTWSAAVVTICVAIVGIRILLPAEVEVSTASSSSISDHAIQSSTDQTLLGRVEKQLRFGVARPLQSDIDRKVVVLGDEAACGASCTGHRMDLWKAGLDVVRQHWLFGIGFGGWRYEMQPRLGFPFTSPHNVTIHLWGMFGLLGLGLNLALYCLVLKRAWDLRRIGAPQDDGAIWAVASTASILMIFIHETAETSWIFSLSRFGLFSWLLLSLQSSTLARCELSNVSKSTR
jgi:hypothetical protein